MVKWSQQKERKTELIAILGTGDPTMDEPLHEFLVVPLSVNIREQYNKHQEYVKSFFDKHQRLPHWSFSQHLIGRHLARRATNKDLYVLSNYY
jgi:hypothetical protein